MLRICYSNYNKPHKFALQAPIQDFFNPTPKHAPSNGFRITANSNMTPKHVNQPTPKHVNHSTPKHVNQLTEKHVNHSTPKHFNQLTEKHVNHSTPKHVNKSILSFPGKPVINPLGFNGNLKSIKQH
jgi:hypothetical protein